jgi:hypothetical protein
MKKLIIGITVLALLVGGTSVAFGRGISGLEGPALSGVEGPALSKACPEPRRRVEGKVTAYGLNVRTGPGVAYPIIGALSQGDVVEVVGKNAAGNWLQILYPTGTEGQGWVAAAYVDLSGSLVEVPEVAAPPLPEAAMASRPTPPPELTGKLVFQVCNGCDIYVINADGSGLRRLTDGMDPA